MERSRQNNLKLSRFTSAAAHLHVLHVLLGPVLLLCFFLVLRKILLGPVKGRVQKKHKKLTNVSFGLTYIHTYIQTNIC